MTVLTLATVALLPVGAIAGILGMNFKAKLFNTNDLGFWIALLAMAAVSIGTILFARYRKLV
jgi:Mg2+ and Co2+ transporter CorA